MSRAEPLSANMEDYLEAIFHISEEKQAARAKDIADRVQVNKSSVTGALKSLSDKGLVNYVPYDIITLTAKGKKVAAEIVRRHEALKEFFVKILLIDKDEAEEASCRVEHAVSKNIIDRLIHFVEFMEICPRGGQQWLKGFRRHCEEGDTANRCGDYIGACLEDLKKRQRQMTSSIKSTTS
jgi:DtxR family Mn-dependent transcriptional regulator